ncbi:MAG: hypothetical protein HQL68_05610 [Magnetococcales bacterium]|nr:hypothetical protein [Magnetococcales bacterium]
MGNIFYASSWGGTATSWLTKVLCMHDNIQCYHGTRYFEDNKNCQEISGIDYAQELNSRAEDGFCVGGIHGYHGDHMEKPITDLGGAFGFLTREPIQRISSLFNHHLSKSKKPENFSNYKFMIDNFITQNGEMLQYLAKFGCFPNAAEKQGTDAELLFTWNMSHALLFESTALNSKAPVFKMEDYTTDPEQFKKLFRYFTKESLTCSQNYLDEVFSVGRANTHRATRSTSEAEFCSWNKNQKLIFYILLKNNRAIIDYYDAIGYPKVKEIIQMIEKS